ncbi:MAG: hypothetical protein K0R03_804 [Moraxellaceae bacterium]|jgi:hypothetical protein|nr:hypothetical protein [Moraxellaceae bacterium]
MLLLAGMPFCRIAGFLILMPPGPPPMPRLGISTAAFARGPDGWLLQHDHGLRHGRDGAARAVARRKVDVRS